MFLVREGYPEFFFRVLNFGVKEYQYHLKDHLGNTRTTFTTKPKEIVFNVSYEGNTDEFLLQEMDNIVDADIHDYQHQDEETNHTKTQKLTGAANSQVGSILSIPVGMGDKISAEVFAKYLPTNNQANPTAAIATLISTAFTGGTGINNELTNQAINTSFSSGSMITNSANNYTYDDQGVMAFLNVLFVPEEAEATVNTEYFAFQQISNGGAAHEQLSINEFVAPKAGYVLVYLTNEDPTYTEVYFDDLTITLNEHPVIQVDSYYPFGLAFENGYQRISNLKNDFKYNGKEEITDLGLDWYDYGARMYMADVGRFFTNDPRAEEFHWQSLYAYAANNPIRFVDINGEGPGDVVVNRNLRFNKKDDAGNYNIKTIHDLGHTGVGGFQQNKNTGKTEVVLDIAYNYKFLDGPYSDNNPDSQLNKDNPGLYDEVKAHEEGHAEQYEEVLTTANDFSFGEHSGDIVQVFDNSLTDITASFNDKLKNAKSKSEADEVYKGFENAVYELIGSLSSQTYQKVQEKFGGKKNTENDANRRAAKKLANEGKGINYINNRRNIIYEGKSLN